RSTPFAPAAIPLPSPSLPSSAAPLLPFFSSLVFGSNTHHLSFIDLRHLPIGRGDSALSSSSPLLHKRVSRPHAKNIILAAARLIAAHSQRSSFSSSPSSPSSSASSSPFSRSFSRSASPSPSSASSSSSSHSDSCEASSQFLTASAQRRTDRGRDVKKRRGIEERESDSDTTKRNKEGKRERREKHHSSDGDASGRSSSQSVGDEKEISLSRHRAEADGEGGKAAAHCQEKSPRVSEELKRLQRLCGDACAWEAIAAGGEKFASDTDAEETDSDDADEEAQRGETHEKAQGAQDEGEDIRDGGLGFASRVVLRSEQRTPSMSAWRSEEARRGTEAKAELRSSPSTWRQEATRNANSARCLHASSAFCLSSSSSPSTSASLCESRLVASSCDARSLSSSSLRGTLFPPFPRELRPKALWREARMDASFRPSFLPFLDPGVHVSLPDFALFVDPYVPPKWLRRHGRGRSAVFNLRERGEYSQDHDTDEDEERGEEGRRFLQGGSSRRRREGQDGRVRFSWRRIDEAGDRRALRSGARPPGVRITQHGSGRVSGRDEFGMPAMRRFLTLHVSTSDASDEAASIRRPINMRWRLLRMNQGNQGAGRDALSEIPEASARAQAPPNVRPTPSTSSFRPLSTPSAVRSSPASSLRPSSACVRRHLASFGSSSLGLERRSSLPERSVSEVLLPLLNLLGSGAAPVDGRDETETDARAEGDRANVCEVVRTLLNLPRRVLYRQLPSPQVSRGESRDSRDDAIRWFLQRRRDEIGTGDAGSREERRDGEANARIRGERREEERIGNGEESREGRRERSEVQLQNRTARQEERPGSPGGASLSDEGDLSCVSTLDHVPLGTRPVASLSQDSSFAAPGGSPSPSLPLPRRHPLFASSPPPFSSFSRPRPSPASLCSVLPFSPRLRHLHAPPQASTCTGARPTQLQTTRDEASASIPSFSAPVSASPSSVSSSSPLAPASSSSPSSSVLPSSSCSSSLLGVSLSPALPRQLAAPSPVTEAAERGDRLERLQVTPAETESERPTRDERAMNDRESRLTEQEEDHELAEEEQELEGEEDHELAEEEQELEGDERAGRMTQAARERRQEREQSEELANRTWGRIWRSLSTRVGLGDARRHTSKEASEEWTHPREKRQTLDWVEVPTALVDFLNVYLYRCNIPLVAASLLLHAAALGQLSPSRSRGLSPEALWSPLPFRSLPTVSSEASLRRNARKKRGGRAKKGRTETSVAGESEGDREVMGGSAHSSPSRERGRGRRRERRSWRSLEAATEEVFECGVEPLETESSAGASRASFASSLRQDELEIPHPPAGLCAPRVRVCAHEWNIPAVRFSLCASFVASCSIDASIRLIRAQPPPVPPSTGLSSGRRSSAVLPSFPPSGLCSSWVSPSSPRPAGSLRERIVRSSRRDRDNETAQTSGARTQWTKKREDAMGDLLAIHRIPGWAWNVAWLDMRALGTLDWDQVRRSQTLPQAHGNASVACDAFPKHPASKFTQTLFYTRR
ncbi:hypothetical protein TGARI_215080A, partial [Toxoplasma gondii ARI]